jgi:hypothetical protein
VVIHHLTVAASEHRDLEAELADAALHAIDDGVVLAGIAGVPDESINSPDLDFEQHSSGHA